MKQAGRFKSDSPDPEAICNPQIGWAWEKKRRESIARTYAQYEMARALLEEWQTVPLTMQTFEEIKRLQKKVTGLKARLRYKGMINLPLPGE